MKKLTKNLYIDVTKISAISTEMKIIGKASERHTAVVVDGQKIRVSENEFNLILKELSLFEK